MLFIFNERKDHHVDSYEKCFCISGNKLFFAHSTQKHRRNGVMIPMPPTCTYTWPCLYSPEKQKASNWAPASTLTISLSWSPLPFFPRLPVQKRLSIYHKPVNPVCPDSSLWSVFNFSHVRSSLPGPCLLHHQPPPQALRDPVSTKAHSWVSHLETRTLSPDPTLNLLHPGGFLPRGLLLTFY